MIARSGPLLVRMLGLSMRGLQVTRMLGELGVATPPLTPSRAGHATAPAHGLDFEFEPPDQIRDADSLDVTPDDLVLSKLFFYSQGYADYAPFVGELPYGLTFDMPVAAVKAILDPLATQDPTRRHSWDFEREWVMVRFADDGMGITRVVVGLPWSGVVRKESRPDPHAVAAAAMVDRLSARGPAARWDRRNPPPGGFPPELVALRREQEERENPFFADRDLFADRAITLTVEPPDAHHLLSCPQGAGYERFFDDVLWLGHDDESGLVGYWKLEAETFVGAPVIRLDSEGSCEVVGPSLVDFYGSFDDRRRSIVTDFCERHGLPLPRTEEQSTEAIAGLPDPELVMNEFVARAAEDARTNQPVRPLDRDPVLVTLTDGTVLVVSNEDALALRSALKNNAAFLFDPTAQRFRTLPPTAGQLSLHGRGVGVLPDNRAIFAETGRETYCVLFDPAASDWRAGARLDAAHDYAGATVLPDGRVLIAGGEESWTEGTARCDIYDPQRDQWCETGHLSPARPQLALVPLAGGALAIGGQLPGPEFEGTDSCERYDVADGVWTPAAPLPFPMRIPTALVLRSGLILVVSIHEGWALYDPSADAWTRSQCLQPARRAAVELADGRVAIFGGGQPGQPAETVFVLDVATGDFTDGGRTQLPRGDSVAALLPGGSVLLVGGDLFNNLAKEPEIWDPATGRGHALPDLAEILDRQIRNLATQRLIIAA
jgi:hypothetical protein